MTRFLAIAALAALVVGAAPAQIPRQGSTTSYAASGMELQLVDATQTAAALRVNGFDFTPGDRLGERSGNGHVHLGDITMRTRAKGGDWIFHSSALHRGPIVAAQAGGLAAAELPGFPLTVVRSWEIVDEALALRFTLENPHDHPIEIGSLSIPMAFNNILTSRSLEEAHARNVFYDPYIGLDAGYVQVNSLRGEGPTLLVVPLEGTPLEGWRPVLEDSTQRGITFEGWQAWMPHTRAWAESEWTHANPWNAPTSRVLDPGQSASYGVRFLVADGPRQVEDRLIGDGRPVAVGIPGYVLPMGSPAKLYLKSTSPVQRLDVHPQGAVVIAHKRSTHNGWEEFEVTPARWGRARLTIRYEDGTHQSVHYRVIKKATDVIADMGRFLFGEQWFDDPGDPFGRGPSIISYDYVNARQVTQDARAWIAGLGDEAGSGSWLAAAMKQLIQPEADQIRQLERFVDETLWGGLQYDSGPLRHGVRKSLFYYEPEEHPYADSIGWDVWSAWNREHAESVGRSYNYPHVAAVHWVMYRLARQGLASNRPWEWYLERASDTALAMVEHAPEYAQFGQMEGTVFLRILEDLQREGMAGHAKALEEAMRARAAVWEALGYPFGSEMPWDSTGQEEVFAWTRHFGMDAKAAVTLKAILAYMPLVPHWGYNGSARRYWDFWYGGHPATSRLERQLHHYGSALNAIPVLTAFRDDPEDFHLLRVGYAGMMGALANVTEEGFSPAAFHSYPDLLTIDGYSGDYGPGFFGHAISTGAYLTNHPEFGWLGFGGEANGPVLRPFDSARMRVFLAPIGLSLTLVEGQFQEVGLDPESGRVRVLVSGDGALLRLESSPGFPSYSGDAEMERGAYRLTTQELVLVPAEVR